MIIRTSLFIAAILTFQDGNGQSMAFIPNKYVAPINEKIIILANVSKDYTADSIQLEMRSAKYKKGLEWVKKKEKIKNGKVKWVLQHNKPIMVYSPGYYAMFEPGDSISITYNEAGQQQFSGEGAGKFELMQKIENIRKDIPAPSTPKSRYHSTVSLQDYLDWMAYLNKQLEQVIPLVESYETRLSPYAFYYYKSSFVCDIEFQRLQKFQSLVGRAKKLGLTNDELSSLYDSIALHSSVKWLNSLTDVSHEIYYYYCYLRITHARKYNFDLEHDSLSNEADRKISYYSLAKSTFKDETLECLLSYLLIDACFNEIGFPPQVEMILKDFYQRPGYAEYRDHVKKMEKKYRAQFVRKGMRVPIFQIQDDKGNTYANLNLQGKITLLNFQNDDCKDCLKTRLALDKVHETFSNSVDFKIINIEAKDANIAALKDLNIYEYPTIYMIDPDGRFLTEPIIGHTENIADQTTQIIKHQFALLHDGPYLFKNNSQLGAFSIYSNAVTTVDPEQKEKAKKTFIAQTDIYNQQFNFKLKEKHNLEPCIFDKPAKLLAISDIEGNFDALRKLLQANKVIDKEFNWIFGNGHLVLNGDMFDRGKQVTECLWLIYSLEEKAKSAGGYVHFILGNHEIMNLSGDIRYVHKKYTDNAQKLGKKYTDLYDPQTELGEWLRTKNIMEKIGDILFVHAGVSEEVNNLPIDITEINNAARAWYDNDSSARKSNDHTLATIFHQENSPFWFRMYYLDQEVKVLSNFDTLYKAPASQVDLTLKKFGVSRIVTGHTMVAHSVSMHYGGKVINTDTPHKEGISEGLLIEREKLYRVNAAGEKFPLIQTNVAMK